MSNALIPPERKEIRRPEPTAVTYSVRRLGSAIGLATIGLLDLLALDDITTDGAFMPEVGFVIASIPALITLAYFTFWPRRSDDSDLT